MPALVGLVNKYVHRIAVSNTIPQTGFADQANTIQLVEGRSNEISVPIIVYGGVNSRTMAWDDGTDRFVASGLPTRISEFVKQINKRYLGSSALNPNVVSRVDTVDGDTGNRLVFTPGATPVGSLQDFEVIISDQLGGYESRGFVIELVADANPSGLIDSGAVRVRLNNLGIEETW